MIRVSRAPRKINKKYIYIYISICVFFSKIKREGYRQFFDRVFTNHKTRMKLGMGGREGGGGGGDETFAKHIYFVTF